MLANGVRKTGRTDHRAGINADREAVDAVVKRQVEHVLALLRNHIRNDPRLRSLSTSGTSAVHEPPTAVHPGVEVEAPNSRRGHVVHRIAEGVGPPHGDRRGVGAEPNGQSRRVQPQIPDRTPCEICNRSGQTCVTPESRFPGFPVNRKRRPLVVNQLG